MKLITDKNLSTRPLNNLCSFFIYALQSIYLLLIELDRSLQTDDVISHQQSIALELTKIARVV